MTKFPRLTLATLLMGSLALPAFALDTTSAKDMSATATSNPVSASVTTKPAHAMKIAQAAGKPHALKSEPLKSGSPKHKVAATSEIPAAVAKAPTSATVGGMPSKDVKAKEGMGKDSMGKETAKDSAVKPQTPAPVTKTN